MLSTNKFITGAIGIGAFIIGGLMARESALEGLELVDKKVEDFKHRNDPPRPSAEQIEQA